jgi:Sec7-like guanine-nucleotide exchange factor
MSEVIDNKKQKRLITEGTDRFNFKPRDGIEFLMEKV